MDGKQIIKSIVTVMAIIVLILVSALVIGSLLDQTLLTETVKTGSSANESGWINSSGYTVTYASLDDFAITSLIILNATDNKTIAAGNYTEASGVITNATALTYASAKVSYSYTFTDGSTAAGVDVDTLSEGFSAFVTAIIGFFSVIGVIIAIVWLIGYIRPLFSKEQGIQSFAGN